MPAKIAQTEDWRFQVTQSLPLRRLTNSNESICLHHLFQQLVRLQKLFLHSIKAVTIPEISFDHVDTEFTWLLHF